jgi:molybdopterin-guanine dinucleotide biosynthesis protein A
MLAGLILAGGKSSRMGTNKSLLTLPDNQLSMLEHCQKQLALVCGNNVFISGEQHTQGIADSIPNCGPLSGIHGGISHIEMLHPSISELLVAAVDMPDLTAVDYTYLLKMGRENQRLCSFENCFLPLYIPLSVAVNQYLTRHLIHQPNETTIQPKKSQYSLKKMMNSLQGLQISPLKETRLDNINTPEQWQQRCAEQSNIRAYK